MGGGEFDEHDYSLSVSDLNNSLYNSSRGAGLQASDVIPPKFKYWLIDNYLNFYKITNF